MGSFTIPLAVLCLAIAGSNAIRCYQCSSTHDPTGEDNCGAYKKFDTQRNTAVECNSEESHMPGSFCVKITKQSPRGFIWNGRWRQVIRQCGSISKTGVTGVCSWGVGLDSVYWEECYCSQDSCNSTPNRISLSHLVLATTCTAGLFSLLSRLYW